MGADLANAVTAKLFLGVLISSELRMHLDASQLWANAQAAATAHSDELRAVRYEDHEYIGCYASAERIALPALQDYKLHIAKQLQRYCPDFNGGRCDVHIFTHLLIQ
jgi:hypothetical protein